ncbi:MAG: iron ABC transporter permease [Sulfurimonadaceae bacterium]|jgi:iron complex transport system permease protein|nr:iron ABC transporter permease [Sulfurimonadaceae bacterium]
MIKLLIWFFGITILLTSPFLGAILLSPLAILEPSSIEQSIFVDIRLPRLIFGFSAGALLALCGLLYQSLFRNPLMTPYTLGISSGAVLGAGIAIKLGLSTLFFGIAMVSLFGFIGAMGTVLLLLFLAKHLPNRNHNSLLLLGIALSLFYTSALMIVFYLGSAVQNDMLLRFSMGSLSIIGWTYPILLSVLTMVVLISLYLYRHELLLLALSEESASLRGVDTKRVTLILLLISALGIGTLVGISGPIGFVGLIIPHIVSKIYPISLTHRIGKTALFGGFFLIFCDTLARTLDTQSELPIGIITALIGAPFFIYLIVSKSKR